jgi:DnaJ-class molecular chaperone
MVQQMTSDCPHCRGTGEKMAEKDRCTTCKGNKVCQVKLPLEVHIAPGTKDNHKQVFPGEGDQAPGIPPGDIIIIIRERAHRTFRRDGLDLFIEMKINLSEALCGFSKSIKHLDDRVLLISSPAGEVIKDGAIKCIFSEGMPNPKHRDLKGRLIIKFNVEFPDSIEISKIPALRGALPQSSTKPDFNMEDAEQVRMSDFDGESESMHMDDDEHEHHGASQGVQCGTQ